MKKVFSDACRPGEAQALPSSVQQALAATVGERAGWERTYQPSAISYARGCLTAGRHAAGRGIAVGFIGRPPPWVAPLAPQDAGGRLKGRTVREGGATLWVLEGDHPTVKALREAVPCLRPAAAANRSSFGFGDRTGLATPGHVAALGKSRLFPVFAQQSMRELSRTQRSADEVMDAAVFGALAGGHTGGFGADADHVKTVEDVDRMAEAGFVMFTLDSTDVIGVLSPRQSEAELDERYREVIAEVPGAAEWERRYAGRTFQLAGGTCGPFTVTLEPRPFRETVVKFGRVIVHCVKMAERVQEKRQGQPWEVEVSVDELPMVTTPGDHLFLASEFAERGVKLASFAPRFIGAFEKGVDYRGDVEEFERSVEQHAAIARAYGGYKLSVHSGSDKFSVYPAVARATEGYFHVKTAGTSYMEALRIVARKAPGFFREIVEFSREQFQRDRATYHVSGRPEAIPALASLPDDQLERFYINEDDGRQIMHVTFGSVLTERSASTWRFRDQLLNLLVQEEEAHTQALSDHLGKHVRLLMGA